MPEKCDVEGADVCRSCREAGCAHEWGNVGKSRQRLRNGIGGALGSTTTVADGMGETLHPSQGAFCLRCGAWRGSLGLEPTLGLYLDHMVEVCREVRRVLRPDGTFWLNIGDSYFSGDKGPSDTPERCKNSPKQLSNAGSARVRATNRKPQPGLKPKDLLLVPARLAIRLQEPYHFGPIKREVDRAWLAGIIDADGCIGIRQDHKENGWNPSYIPYLTVGCSDVAILERCVAITGLGKVNLKSHAGDTDRRGISQRRDGYVWRLDGQIASRVIRDILPFLVQKGVQARVCDAMNQSQAEHRPSKSRPVAKDVIAYRQALYEGIKSLNQREPVDLPKMPEPLSNVEPMFYVRKDIILAKRAPMPESCEDRPTSSHEHLLLLTKAPRYFWDRVAVMEEFDTDEKENYPARSKITGRAQQGFALARGADRDKSGGFPPNGAGRNMRDVWWLSPSPFPGAHFATFPPELPRRCILAGTSAKGVCPKCGAPWFRVVEKRLVPTPKAAKTNVVDARDYASDGNDQGSNRQRDGHMPGWARADETLGWRAGCGCEAGAPVPATVLDPFLGSGTTAMVADRLSRDAIGIELSPKYARMAENRLRDDAGMFADIAAE